MDPHLHSSQRDGQFGHSRDQIGLKNNSTNESTDGPTDDDVAQPLSEPDEAEEAGIRVPCLPLGGVAPKGDRGLPMLHTEGQWDEMMRQGSPSWTLGGRKSLSPR